MAELQKDGSLNGQIRIHNGTQPLRLADGEIATPLSGAQGQERLWPCWRPAKKSQVSAADATRGSSWLLPDWISTRFETSDPYYNLR